MERSGENGTRLRQRGTPIAQLPGSGPRDLRPWPENRIEFEGELIRKLDLLWREIEGLRRRLRYASRGRNVQYAELLDALESKFDRLRRQIEWLAATPESSWDGARAEAVESWRKLKRHLILVALAMHRDRSGGEPEPTAKRPRR